MIAIQQVTVSQFPEVVTANRCEVSQISVLPGVGASGGVVLGNESAPDAEGKTTFVPCTGSTTVAMTAAQYAAWGTDDNYAVDCLLANLNLVRV